MDKNDVHDEASEPQSTPATRKPTKAGHRRNMRSSNRHRAPRVRRTTTAAKISFPAAGIPQQVQDFVDILGKSKNLDLAL
jgi:hypothetical protein